MTSPAIDSALTSSGVVGVGQGVLVVHVAEGELDAVVFPGFVRFRESDVGHGGPGFESGFDGVADLGFGEIDAGRDVVDVVGQLGGAQSDPVPADAGRQAQASLKVLHLKGTVFFQSVCHFATCEVEATLAQEEKRRSRVVLKKRR